MSMGHTNKFFGFYISYTILNLPIYFLPTIYACLLYTSDAADDPSKV